MSAAGYIAAVLVGAVGVFAVFAFDFWMFQRRDRIRRWRSDD